jgi:putative ABC transport system permease protein
MLISNDVRFALRTLRRQPAFATAAILSFGLAIGASTAIFSVVHATLLRALPFRTPDRIAVVWGVAMPRAEIRGGSFAEIADWARLNRTFESFSYWNATSLNLRTETGADRINAEMVSASYFSMLGVNAVLGRVFSAAEDAVPGAHPVIVISHSMWTSRFGADPSIIGRTLTVNDQPFTVLGVMPDAFRGLAFNADIWFPSAMAQANGSGPLDNRQRRFLGAVGRLKDGITLAEAQIDMERVAAQLAAEYPASNTDRSVRLFELRDSFLGPASLSSRSSANSNGATRGLILAVFGAVGLLLLIACTSVVGLQLVRAAGRRREFAVRVAIGAERGQLVRQLVVEGVVLALGASAFGLIVGWWGLRALIALTPTGLLPGYAIPTLNLSAFTFAIVIATLCGVVFGLLPAFRVSGVNLSDDLRQGARGTAGGFGHGRRLGSNQLVIVAEAAVTVVLLIGAGLFVRSLQNELRVDPGFDTRNLVQARLVFPASYDTTRRRVFAKQLRDQIAAQSGVRGVAFGSDMPLMGIWSAGLVHIDASTDPVRFFFHAVDPEFFRSLGIRVVTGRSFTAHDRSDTEPVVMISESMARRFWPDQSPIGRRMRIGLATGPEVTIVGIVEDMRYRDLRTSLATSDPDVFFPFEQRPMPQIHLAVRSTSEAAAVGDMVARELRSLDPTIPLFGVSSVDALLHQQTASGRFGSTLLMLFGAAALLLTAVGLYGVLAFSVSIRHREIGVRIALGATYSRILQGIIGHGVALVTIGVAAGLAGAAFLTRWLATQLYGVGQHDLTVFAGVSIVLLVVAILASWVPGARAARVQPTETLRAG